MIVYDHEVPTWLGVLENVLKSGLSELRRSTWEVDFVAAIELTQSMPVAKRQIGLLFLQRILTQYDNAAFATLTTRINALITLLQDSNSTTNQFLTSYGQLNTSVETAYGTMLIRERRMQRLPYIQPDYLTVKKAILAGEIACLIALMAGGRAGIIDDGIQTALIAASELGVSSEAEQDHYADQLIIILSNN